MINLHKQLGVLGLIGAILWVGRGYQCDTTWLFICARGRCWFVAGPGLWAEFDHQDLCH